MPTPPLSRETAQEAVNALQIAIDAGYAYPGERGKLCAVAVAAGALGVNATTMANRVRAARERFGLKPAPKAPPPPAEPEPVAKPRVRVKSISSADDAPVYRVLGIGDVHVKPGRTTEHLKWIGRHAAETAPDYVMAIGDWLSLDSCSMHAVRGSYSDHDRPSFSRDIEAGEESLHEFRKACPDEIRKVLVYGNHEHRAWRRAELEPKLADDFPLRVEEMFCRYGWKAHEYGKPAYIGNCAFVHVPLNGMGKPYGGKHSENQIGNDATHSWVWGHDHRGRFKTVPKLGPNNRISLLNLGTAMPKGVIEDYNVGTTGWTYGAWDIRIQGGVIVSAKFHDMDELAENYGD